jgi:hypothetical protein
MTQLLRVDFKNKRLVSKHVLGDLVTKSALTFKCICCGSSYTNDKTSATYCEAVSWNLPTKTSKEQTLHLCKHCVQDMYVAIKGE